VIGDDIADGIDAVAQATGIAWLWERIKDLVRPVFDSLFRWLWPEPPRD
jgi:hypothetical protein